MTPRPSPPRTPPAAVSSDAELAAVPQAVLDRVHLHSAEAMSELPDPAVAVAILAVLGVPDEDEDGLVGAEPVLATCARLGAAAPVSA
jgi:hypothetical protein